MSEKDTGGEVVNSYWNIETTGTRSSDGGSGLTDSRMKRKNSFLPEWSIVEFQEWSDEVWYIEEGNDHPRLGWERAN